MNDFPDHSAEGFDILYADDDTSNLADQDPEILEMKLQEKANSATAWIQDNKMICSGEKTKLLVVATRELRAARLDRKLEVKVGGKNVVESKDEKLLGIIMSNDLTWHTHLYGNQLKGKERIVGLIPQLSQRVGLLSKLAKVMSKRQLQLTCSGIFTSKLLYGLPIFSNVWGLPDLDDSTRKFSAFTRDDCRRLQVLQNKTQRMITGIHEINTTTDVLLGATDCLSVQQLGAFHSVLTAFKAIHSGKPEYLARNLSLRRQEDGRAFPHRQTDTIHMVANASLTISRSGFFYRTSKIWNLLPGHLRSERGIGRFKTGLRKWILENVPRKPP